MPPSMRIVVPVIVPARALARNVTRSATSSGVVNRPIGISAIVSSTTFCGSDPARAATVAATPVGPSHKGV